MNQVHKESLSQVENALPNRQGLDVEIFGMEGIPEEIVQQHNQRIIQNFYQAQADRHAATGNPPPGQNPKRPPKKIKIESPEEIKQRLAEHRARVAAQKAANGGSANPTPPQGLPDGHSPSQTQSPGAFVCLALNPHSLPGDFKDLQRQLISPSHLQNSPFPPPGGAYPGFAQQPVPGYPPSNLPTRPGSNAPAPPASNLPARPGQPGWQGGSAANASTIDELVAGAARQGDDIDHIIRMAEAGIKPSKKPDTEAAAPTAEGAEKKSKKDKVRMVYEDELSPEERMAMMPRYAFAPEAVGA